MRKWESYGPSNITDKTKYWVDLWEDLVDRVNEQIDGLDLTNPQLALREIVDEINYNHLRNHENKRYFKRLLKRIKDRDPVLKEKAEKAGIDFVFLLKEFDGGSNPYLLELCKRTLDILADGRYFERACALLKSIVLPATWQKGEEGTLLTLSQSLIAELMLRGYSLETIRNQPGNLFASYFERNGRLVTDYPLSFSWREFVREGSLDLAAYNSAVRVEVDSLSLEQRIDRLRYYMIAPPIDGYVIFRIDGIKGSAGLDVGPVSFYSPNSKRYLTDPALPSLEAETFGAPGPVYFINAAVRTRFLDKTAVLADAIETLETALDLLSAYLPTNMKLSIRRGSYLITDLEGRNVGYELSISERDEAYSYSKSFDLDRFPIATLGGGELSPLLQGIGGFLFQAPESQTDTEQKIAQSMHWYRKGKESNGSADKLLSYWIAIENLLDFGVATANLLLPKNEEETEFAIARLLLPRLHASKYIYDVGHRLWSYLQACVASSDLKVDQALLETAGLTPPLGTGEYELDISRLVGNLPSIIAAADRKLIKDKCERVRRFYGENKFAEAEIRHEMERISDDVTLIYRYRNQIVHNARFDNRLLPYLAQRASTLAEFLLKRIAFERTTNKADSIEKIVIADYARVNRIMERFAREVTVDLLNLDL